MLTKETLVGIVLSAARYPDVRGRKVLEGRNPGGRKPFEVDSSSPSPSSFPSFSSTDGSFTRRCQGIIVDTCRIECVTINWICLCVYMCIRH